jgi:hypothetical protein
MPARPALRRRPRGRSTRAFIKARAPDTKVFVTVDSGAADIEDAELIAPADLPAAIEARRFATIVKSPACRATGPIFAMAREAGHRGDLQPQPLGRDLIATAAPSSPSPAPRASRPPRRWCT